MSSLALVSLEEARALGLKKYFTGVVCGRGHLSERLTSNRNCIDCAKVRARLYFVSYYANNAENFRSKSRAWRKVNLEKARAVARIAGAAWSKRNMHIRSANGAARYADKIKATPQWANRKAIIAVYAESRRLTETTSLQHAVDHIVPLKHPLVCGLHVHYNLRAIPAIENLLKNNRFNV